MATSLEQFLAFWAHVRQNLSEAKFSKMLKTLHHSLLKELDNPLVNFWSPHYLAFRTVRGAVASVDGTGIITTGYPIVVNSWQSGKDRVSFRTLRYLAKPASKGGELLLDILETGQASVNRDAMASALHLPGTMNPPVSAAPVAENPSGADTSATTASPEASKLVVTNSPGADTLVATNPSEVDAATASDDSGTGLSMPANPSESDIQIDTASFGLDSLITTISPRSNASVATASTRDEEFPHKSPSPPHSQSSHAIRSWTRPQRFRNQRARLRAARMPHMYIDEIYIPTLVDIRRHLQPHFPHLEDTYMIWLKLNKDRRIVAFGPQDDACLQLDPMALDRHRQEFRWMILSYVWNCLDMDQSRDFKTYHQRVYTHETRSWRDQADWLARNLNERSKGEGQ
ncbi:hypothetical protein GGR51DRAFT_565492 [Nemania sp. FL0031]|nr:hypothetical protein GGR51DRAFT_565492 [Nemania sp. FL0031]